MRKPVVTRTMEALLRMRMLHGALSLVPAFAVASPQPLRLAESSDGVVFTASPEAVRPHPLGHVVRMQGHAARPQLLDRSDPGGASYLSVESTWVLACHAGTYAIVLDRFLDERGGTVAVFTESPSEQQVPEPGSLVETVFRRLCAYIGRSVPSPGAGL